MSVACQLQAAVSTAHDVRALALRIGIMSVSDASGIAIAMSFVVTQLEAALMSSSKPWNLIETEKLTRALSACLGGLKAASKAVSPAGIMLLSGALARRLGSTLADIATALASLTLNNCRLDSGGGVSSSVGAGGNCAQAGQRSSVSNMLRPHLSDLQERAMRADLLRRRLEGAGLESPTPAPASSAAASGSISCCSNGSVEHPPASAVVAEAEVSSSAAPSVRRHELDIATALACVHQSLKDEGMVPEYFQHPQMVSELVSELYDLANERSLVNDDEAQLINTVASALLYGIGVASDGDDDGAACRSSVAGGVPSSAAAAATAPLRGCTSLIPLPQTFTCPLTLQLLRDPVITAAGHTYERATVEAWLRRNNTDPKTRERLTSKALTPNWALKGAIEELLSRLGLTHDEVDDLAGADGAGAADVRPTERETRAGSAKTTAAVTATAAAGAAAGSATPGGPSAAAAAGGLVAWVRLGAARASSLAAAAREEVVRRASFAVPAPVSAGSSGLVNTRGASWCSQAAAFGSSSCSSASGSGVPSVGQQPPRGSSSSSAISFAPSSTSAQSGSSSAFSFAPSLASAQPSSTGAFTFAPSSTSAQSGSSSAFSFAPSSTSAQSGSCSAISFAPSSTSAQSGSSNAFSFAPSPASAQPGSTGAFTFAPSPASAQPGSTGAFTFAPSPASAQPGSTGRVRFPFEIRFQGTPTLGLVPGSSAPSGTLAASASVAAPASNGPVLPSFPAPGLWSSPASQSRSGAGADNVPTARASAGPSLAEATGSGVNRRRLVARRVH